MAEVKTKKTKVNVEDFLKAVKDEQKREDSFVILDMMKKLTKMEPRMWGPTMIGFGDYHYKYASGHEGDTFMIGFSPRKDALTLYLCYNIKKHTELLKKLGKHKASVACLYIKRLSDVDIKVLKELFKVAFAETKALKVKESKK